MPKRKRKDITLPIELFNWIEKEIEKGSFYNFSHACESGLRRLKQEKEEDGS